jgi:hypothetical protein
VLDYIGSFYTKFQALDSFDTTLGILDANPSKTFTNLYYLDHYTRYSTLGNSLLYLN